MKSEKGFTLVEMMIVMLVISVLLIVTIPNVAKHNANINDKGCEAFVKMVQAQVQSYQLKHNKIPTLQQLIDEEYIKTTGCPDNNREVIIGLDGAVTTVEKTSVTP
ncbi:MAG: competence type IV pilus major pilin ComGC [Neobacillus sp.]|jgi:competence protein ComGC